MRSKVLKALSTNSRSSVVGGYYSTSTARDGICAWRIAEELATRQGRTPHYLCPCDFLLPGWLRHRRRHVAGQFPVYCWVS